MALGYRIGLCSNFHYTENRDRKYGCQEVFRQAVMAYIVNESSQNRVKMEMSPSAFKPKMCALTYLCQMGLLERDVGARILGFSPYFDGLP